MSVLSIRGEVDIAYKQTLNDALDSVLGQRSKRIIVNLLQTTYADSTCIQAIIRAGKQAQQLDKTIDLVVEKDSYLQKLVSVTGLGRMFRIYGSLEAAIYLPNSDATKKGRLDNARTSPAREVNAL